MVSHPNFTPCTVLLAEGIIGLWNAEEFMIKTHMIQMVILLSYLTGYNFVVSYILKENTKHHAEKILTI